MRGPPACGGALANEHRSDSRASVPRPDRRPRARSRRRRVPVLGDRRGASLPPWPVRSAAGGAEVGDPVRDQRRDTARARARDTRARRPDRGVPRAAGARPAARLEAGQGSGRRARVEERGEGDRNRVRPRHRGLRLDRRPWPGRDERARRRRDRAIRGSIASTALRMRRRWSSSTRTTISRCSACPGCAAGRSTGRAGSRHGRSHSSAIRGTARSHSRLVGSAGRATILSRDAYGRRSDHETGDGAKGPGRAGKLGRAGSRRRGQGANDGVRAPATASSGVTGSRRIS